MKDLLDIQIIPMGSSYNCDRCNDLPLAYSYVPYQSFEKTYNKEKALSVGTVFPSLNKPLGVYGKEFSEMAGVKKL
jgi:hypothetical protein